MRRIIRMGVTVIVGSVIVILASQYIQFAQMRAASEQTAVNLIQDETTIAPTDLTVTVSATGSVSPFRQVPLVFQMSAPVSEVLVEVGQTVKQGDVLARLDMADLGSSFTNAQLTLETQQTTYAALIAPAREVDIAAAQAAVNVAQAQLSGASLGADANQIEIARLQAEIARNALWQAQLQRDLGSAQAQLIIDQAAERGVDTSSFPEVPDPADNVPSQITQAEYSVNLADVTAEGVENQPADVAALSAANAQLVSAQAQLDRLLNGASEIELQIAGIRLQIAELAVNQAEVALNRAVLIAPFDGTVSENNLTVGQVPSSEEAAMQLIATSSYYVDVSIDETDIVKLQVGQKVILILDALPDEQITGVVTRVALTPVRAGQLVTYLARVTLDPTTALLRVGMTSTATIIINELENVLTVPNRFIRLDRSTQQAYVTIQRPDGVFLEVPVVLGVRNEIESQIVSGVETGQTVVLLPRESLNPIDG